MSIALNTTSDEAADFLGQTLNAFGKGAESGQEFADIIANVRTSTSLDFQRIKDALGFVAPTANALGLSLGQVSAQIGVLQDNGIKAARAGRLLNTSFARLVTKGKSLDEALEDINKSQNKVITATNLFGAESFTLGLILADNVEKTADLANEFDNLSDGSLKRLTDEQLESLDAKIKILDSTWEKFILSVENGTGVFSVFTKNTISNTTKLIDGFRRLNQTAQENIAEDVSIRVRGIESQVIKTTKIIIDNAKKERDREVAIFKEKLDANKVSQEDFNQAVGRSNKKLSDSEKNARNDAILSQIAIEKNVRERLLQNNEFTDITIENASKVIEKNKESLASTILNGRVLKLIGKDDNIRKREEAANIEIQTARIEKLKTLIEVQTEEAEVLDESTEAKLGNSKATKELIGLINLQAKAVSDLNVQIREAKTEEDILNLSKQNDIARKELKRLQRIVSSSIEEFDKMQLDLIEDQTEKVIAKEKEKNEKLIALIRSNAKVKGTTEARLTLEQAEAIDQIEANQAAFKLDAEIKRDKKLIEQKASFAKAEFNQRRSGFKTEEDFEKEKEAQFKAIKIKAIDEELELLKDANREKDELRIEQLKGERASLFEFEKKTSKDFTEIQLASLGLLERAAKERSDRRLKAIDDELSASEKVQDQLRESAAKGVLDSDKSLASEQKKQAELERQAQQEARKQELRTAGFKILSALLEQGKSPQEAIPEVGVLLGALPAVIDSIPTFYQGTNTTVADALGSPHLNTSRDGYVIRADGSEKILNPNQSARTGGMTTDQITNVAESYNKGMLGDLHNYNQPSIDVSSNNNWQSNQQVISKFESLERSNEVNLKRIEKAINDKPALDDVKYDRLLKEMVYYVSDKGTKKKVRSSSKNPSRSIFD